MRLLAGFLAFTMTYFSLLPSVHAAMVSTADLVAEQEIKFERTQLLQALDREDVRTALIQQGVDPEIAKQRVASLADAEVQLLNQKINELPAGSGVLEVLLIIFLVLLFTDIMGWTDIFPFVNKPK
ncbi:MAG: hypothetical protein AMJ53_05080 [Gammaproteobacteria bacterium SG8_11]|nr:MAG: hypothetical protein AMJ53_05080 [Gammaproteobacteria bacterium SG8_11]